MDYEKKYKEAVNKIKNLLDDGEKNGFTIVTYKTDLESIFPELKELEDERIRKEIITFIATTPKQRNSHSKWLTWLEKQGEQPSAIRWYDVSLIPQEMEELLVEWDSEDATWHEIAFYHADTKTFWNGTRQVENVTRWCYIVDLLEKQGESYTKRDVDNAYLEGMAFTKNELEKQAEVVSDKDDIEAEEKGIRKAFNKIWEEKQDKQKSQRMISAEAKEAMYAKTAWSEEDEEMLVDAYVMLDWYKGNNWWTARRIKDWLNSLKERIGG